MGGLIGFEVGAKCVCVRQGKILEGVLTGVCVCVYVWVYLGRVDLDGLGGRVDWLGACVWSGVWSLRVCGRSI